MVSFKIKFSFIIKCVKTALKVIYFSKFLKGNKRFKTSYKKFLYNCSIFKYAINFIG